MAAPRKGDDVRGDGFGTARNRHDLGAREQKPWWPLRVHAQYTASPRKTATVQRMVKQTEFISEQTSVFQPPELLLRVERQAPLRPCKAIESIRSEQTQSPTHATADMACGLTFRMSFCPLQGRVVNRIAVAVRAVRHTLEPVPTGDVTVVPSIS